MLLKSPVKASLEKQVLSEDSAETVQKEDDGEKRTEASEAISSTSVSKKPFQR
jgi:hypothetical protein